MNAKKKAIIRNSVSIGLAVATAVALYKTGQVDERIRLYEIVKEAGTTTVHYSKYRKPKGSITMAFHEVGEVVEAAAE